MALDPRQTFGKLGTTAFNAPKAAQLAPEQTIEGASLVGQVNAKLGGTVVDAVETIRKAGIVNEKQQLDAMGAQLSAKEAQIRADMFKEEMTTGKKFTPDEQTNLFAQRLDEARNELKDKYRFSFIPDEADSYYTRHKETAVANHTKQVVLPRMAELNRDSLLSEIDGNQKAAASLMAAGDIDGALAKTQAAAQVLEKPNAAVVFDPAQRSAHQQKILQDGVKDILFTLPPEKRLELLRKDAALKASAAAAGDPTLAIASPLKNLDQTFIANMTKHTELEIRQEAERVRTEQRRAESEKANAFQFAQTEFMLDPKTSSGALQKRMFEVLQAGRELSLTNPGSPMLDAYGAAARQMQNEVESRQRKAEAAAAKAERERSKSVDVGSFLASGQVVDPTNKGSRAVGDAAYEQLEKQIGKLPPAEADQRRLELISRLKYIPAQVERQITQGLTSDKPELRAATLAKVKAITDVAPSAILNLPQREQTIARNAIRNGMPLDVAIKNYDNDAIRSPEEKKIINEKADKETGDKGKFNTERVLKKTFDAENVPVAAQATYKSKFDYYFSTNGGNAELASKEANADIAREFSVTNSDGKPVLRQKQPDKFGLTPEQERYQVGKALIEKGFTGKENYRLTYVTDKNGSPAYGVEVANKYGVMTPIPGVLALDKNEQIVVPPKAAPVAPPPPGPNYYGAEETAKRMEKQKASAAEDKQKAVLAEAQHAAERAGIAESMKKNYGKK